MSLSMWPLIAAPLILGAVAAVLYLSDDDRRRRVANEGGGYVALSLVFAALFALAGWAVYLLAGIVRGAP
jgi:hypothetical protein